MTDNYDHLNPVDSMIMSKVDGLTDWFKNNGFNSSGVSTLSIVFGILSLKLISDKAFWAAALSYMVYYVLDHIDESIAKKYEGKVDPTSQYDTVKNIVVHGLIAYSVYSNYSQFEGCTSKLFFLSLIAVIVMGLMHMGCVKVQNGTFDVESNVGKALIGICPATDKEGVIEVMKVTKYFGAGTLVLAMAVLIGLMGEYTK
jgi:phosphatidylserine synthase